MKRVNIYTDGACSGNPGWGGYAAIIIYKGVEKIVKGAEKETTNNRMELMAAIEGLKALKENCAVDLYSDSAYTVNAFTEGWIYGWIDKGWITSTNKEVANVDLWKELYSLSRMHKVNFIKVKGHSDNEYNNRCDQIARSEIKDAQKRT